MEVTGDLELKEPVEEDGNTKWQGLEWGENLD